MCSSDLARVSGNAQISGAACVYRDALVYGNAQVSEDARVYGNAQVYGDARVSGNAQIFGAACVYRDALVSGNAQVSGNAWVSGDAQVSGNAQVYGDAWVISGLLISDMFSDLKQLVAASLNVFPINGKYTLYKRVNKTNKIGIFKSCHDPSFIYKLGKWARVKDFDPDKRVSCERGIHASTPFYWREGDTLLAVEVKLSDIITCLEGKIRAKAVKPICVIN